MRDRTVIGVLALLALMRGRRPDIPWGTGWYWPVPSVRYPSGVVRHPVVSDGFNESRAHPGVDIVIQGDPNHAPAGTPITAARAGAVWSVQKTPRGWSVVVDHGKPFATFYQHLQSVEALAKGMPVAAGQRLGVMGIDPLDKQRVRHLHFAVWFDGYGDIASVDPAPVIGGWLRPGTWSVT